MTSAILLALVLPSSAPATPLWSIGEPGGRTRFELGPGNYRSYTEDPLFLVGRSDPEASWPYVHPGPSDGWAGSRRHTFRVFFNLKTIAGTGTASLDIGLRDTHHSDPPTVAVTVNGATVAIVHTVRGRGDETVFGNSSAGRRSSVRAAFSATRLHQGVNEVDIENRSGSWMLYDRVTMSVPGAVLGTAPRAAVGFDAPEDTIVDRRPAGPSVAVRMHSLVFGAPLTAQVQTGTGTSREVILPTGSRSVTLHVPAPGKPTSRRFTARAGGVTLGSVSLEVRPIRPWVLYIIPHSHVDIGYTALQPDVLKTQIANFDEAMRLCEKTRNYPEDSRFKWNSEVLWGADGYMRETDHARRAAFWKAVKRGDVELQALYGNELTGLCRPEEMFRLVDLAVRWRKERGVKIDTAMISDVPGYSWGLVPALAQSGIRYFSSGPNPGDRTGGTLVEWGDKPFWWVGPSGKDRVLCWVAGLGYAAFHGSSLANGGRPWIASYLRRLEEAEYPYDMVQIRYTTGDNGRPDPGLSDFVRKWNDTHVAPRLVIATASRMFHDFEKAYGSKLPVRRGDMTPYWEDGAGSSARETAENRAAAEKLVQAEKLWAMFAKTGYQPTAFDEAWRNVVLYDEHTWGAYNSISEPDSPFVAGQWAIKKGFADLAGAMASDEFGTAACLYSHGHKVVVADTSSWPRSEVVTIDSRAGDRVESGGRAVPSQRLADGKLAFLAEGVPGLGTKCFTVTKGKPATFKGVRASGLTLSGGGLSVTVDRRNGSISGIRATGRGVNLVDSKVGVNRYLYLPGGNLEDLKFAGGVRVTVKERGPLVASLLLVGEAPGCVQLTREVRLTAGRDCVEIVDTVDKSPVREKEGVHFAFGFNVPNAVTRLAVPWGVERPEVDQLPGSCKNAFSVQRWVDASNSRGGVTVASPDSVLWEVGGVTANLPGSQPDPRAWMSHIRSSSALYAWVMNNHWHTNYRAEQSGPTVFRYFIRPHGRFDAAAAERFGEECSQPLIALDYAPRLLRAPIATVKPMGHSTGIEVSTMRPTRDRTGLFLRLYNASSSPAAARLSFPAKRRLWFCDAAESKLKPAPAVIRLPAWGVISLRAE